MALDGANAPKDAAPPANDDRRQPKSAPPSGTAEDRTLLNGGAASSESEASPHDPNDGAAAAEKKDNKDPTQVATVREVFSFAKTTRVKVCIALSFIMAAVSGCVLPGTACGSVGSCWVGNSILSLAIWSCSNLILPMMFRSHGLLLLVGL
jgi:hypothetical protein